MFIGYIYKYTDIKNNKVYIGQTTKTVKQRDREHRSSKTNNLFNNKLQQHYEDFILDTIATITCNSKIELFNSLNCLEKKYIKLYDCIYPNGYNLTTGGKNCEMSEDTKRKLTNCFKGRHHTKETKEKLSKINTGKHHSEETKKKITTKLLGSKNPFYGRHHTEETKRKISEKAKKRCSGKGNPMFGRVGWNKGMKTPDEIRKKISESNKGNKSLLGKHWCNNGIINKTYTDNIPDGFVRGKLVKKEDIA